MVSMLFVCVALAQAPARSATPPAGGDPAAPTARALTPAEQRQAELRRLVEQRKLRHARGAAAHRQALGQAQAARRQAQAGPGALNPAQVGPGAFNPAGAAQAQALQRLADAEQRRAAAAEAQYRLDSQASGAPQVFVPGQGMMPYANGVAPPWWWGLRYGFPQSAVPGDVAPGQTLTPTTVPPPAAGPTP